MRAHGVAVDEFISRFGAWPPPQAWLRPAWLAATLADRVLPVLRSHSYNLTLLQREFASTLYTLERFTGRPRVLDVDDAVWLNGPRARVNFEKLARACDGVICGNDYIAQTMSKWNPRITIIPTAVDTERFNTDPRASLERTRQSRLVIGWSGLHAGSKYLLGIEEALHRVLVKRRDAVLRVVSDARPSFRLLDDSMVEYVPWSPDNEVPMIQTMDIGLMPIDDTEWSKGKCSYKMLLYMACGVPVVVSPYGMNAQVLGHAQVGLGPRTGAQWSESIIELLDNPARRNDMGIAARGVVERHYSLRALAPQMASFLLTFKA